AAGDAAAVPDVTAAEPGTECAPNAQHALRQAGGSARSAQVSWQCSDITAARHALGWSPSHPLDSSLAALWAAVRPRARSAEGAPAR
ncbi:NAD(P)-dependent oxidoreductase, partial [Streptomyces sp. NPDC048564]